MKRRPAVIPMFEASPKESPGEAVEQDVAADATIIACHTDREFWDMLGKEGGPSICADADCVTKTIEHSIYCRRHHYQAVKAQRCPFAD